MIPTISLDALKQKMERGDDFFLVDALPAEKFNRGHLPGAVNIPASKVDALAPQLIPDRSAEIIVYCSGHT